jgi:hypothetical protein
VLDALSSRLAQLRDRARRFTRRRRRPLAAALSGVAVFIALTSLRSPETHVLADTPAPGQSLIRPGEAAVPIVLSSPAMVRTISPGSVVDIVGVPRDEGSGPRVVVHGARVIDIPDGGSGLSMTSTPIVLVAVPDADALPLVATSSRDSLGIVIRAIR